jgi:hypothetical protein
MVHSGKPIYSKRNAHYSIINSTQKVLGTNWASTAKIWALTPKLWHGLKAGLLKHVVRGRTKEAYHI